MSLTGDLGSFPVEVRESPTQPSTGEVTITDLGGGNFQIDSFFDIFTELSVNGGLFDPDSNGPARMELCPEPASLGLLIIGGLALLRRRKRYGFNGK